MSGALLCGRRFRTFNVVDDFNRTSRDELLDQHLFTTLDDFRETSHRWTIEYSEERPHEALNDLTP